MRTIIWIPALFLLVSVAPAQEPNPSNLYVAELKYRNNRLELGTPRKLTGDRGRNSQPSFTPDGRAIVFNAVREGPGGQGDVYRIDLATGAETRVTQTPENENSPTYSPDGQLLVIRWKPETLFREWGLWIYGNDGTPERGVLPGPDTVGYFMPIDRNRFVLVRPTSRFSLAFFDANTGRTTDIEWPVARLPPQRIPGETAISFVRTDSAGRNQIRRLDPATLTVTAIGPTVPGRTVHTWARRGLILMGKGNTVHGWSPGDSGWRPVARLAQSDLQNVGTYVVSPDGRWLILTSTLKLPLHVAMTDSLEAGQSADEVANRFRSIRQRVVDQYYLSENDLVGLGSARQSISLLGFVTELFPASWRPQRALGDALRAGGEPARAAAAYRRSLELNPRSTPAEREAAAAVEQALRELTR